ncbi:MAG: biotin--[acetyl-CoA-carboxylase] ligase [Rhodospirillales bacterium]|nr:biotin--[acetyl-CoA-carboxylase] ligase [Rhodospirillales bacterium]
MAAIAQLPAGFRLIALDTIGSTNEEAKRLAATGTEHGTVVWARAQTAGKARRGRRWVSEPGNLYCSFLLRPDCAANIALQASFIAAVALAETLSGLLDPSVHVACKWPNDVLVDGRKVAGILLETSTRRPGSVDWLVVGVGVNIAHYPSDAETPATSLAVAGRGDLDPLAVLKVFAGRLASWLDRWKEQGFAPVRGRWLEYARGIGETVTVRLADESIEGIFVGLDSDGALMLAQGAATRRVSSGDVFLGRRH